MSFDVSFNPVTLATKNGVEEGQLVLVNQGITAILAPADANAQGEMSWYLHSGFGPCEAEGVIFADLGAAEAWVRARLEHAKAFGSSSSDQAEPTGSEAPLRPLRVLIVEDNAIHALQLEDLISRLGYDVVETVASGSQAIAAAQTLHPDLVFMDVQLAGGTDGIAAAQAIHERFAIPCVFVTGFTDPETLAKIEQVMPLELLSKPVNATALTAALLKAAQLRGCNRLS